MGWRCGLRGWSALGILGVTVAALVAASSSSESSLRQQVQTGLASYYGPGFHSEGTASGETFNQHALSAAHRTLPLGTVVRVTNLENGRHVELRISDRGPYCANRGKGTIIDVSRAAARRLDFLEEGLVLVRVEVVRQAEARGWSGA